MAQSKKGTSARGHSSTTNVTSQHAAETKRPQQRRRSSFEMSFFLHQDASQPLSWISSMQGMSRVSRVHQTCSIIHRRQCPTSTHTTLCHEQNAVRNYGRQHVRTVNPTLYFHDHQSRQTSPFGRALQGASRALIVRTCLLNVACEFDQQCAARGIQSQEESFTHLRFCISGAAL